MTKTYPLLVIAQHALSGKWIVRGKFTGRALFTADSEDEAHAWITRQNEKPPPAAGGHLGPVSIQCPHCRFGFAPSVIDQHIREKH